MRQHADNPVEWWPWGDDAFYEAKRRDVPVFLSIGYATCHWCHVMAHESFEDEEVARLMNDAFVCIKVDREERPDIDAAYMAACQATTGSGGWPLTAVLDHERRPWFVGTYFPKETRGRMGMLELVPTLADAWQNKREEVLRSSEHIVAHAQGRQAEPGEPNPEWFDRAEQDLLARFDAENGGFGTAPKFPSPHQLRFLLRRHVASGRPEPLEAVTRTLDGMLKGGIHDHVGGGFHRYSTDPHWHLPHFEKMLYDQAMLMRAYTEAWQVTRRPEYAAAVNDIARYVERDLRHAEGAFFSAEDADSEGEEGTFYIWRHDEVQSVVSNPASFCTDFQVNPDGNFNDEATGQPHPANILHATHLDAMSQHGDDLTKLLAIRSQRVRPLLDDKILTDWNGLMIGALAQAGAALGRVNLTHLAGAAARFILEHLRPKDRLRHRIHDGRTDRHAFLDDYAFLAAGLLDLFETTGETQWLVEAEQLAQEMVTLFSTEQGAMRLRATSGEAQVIERIDAYDGAIPSGNSVAVDVLDRLARITGRPEHADAAWNILRALASDVERAPSAYTALLGSAWAPMQGGSEIVLTGNDPTMRRAASETLVPGAVRIVHSGEETVQAAPWLADYDATESRAYVCRNHACEAPVDTAESLRDSLQG